MSSLHDTQLQKRVAIYLRVSTEEQAEHGYGLDLQRDAIEATIRSKGKLSDGSDSFVFAGEQHVYLDDGISGSTPLEERPAFSRMMEDLYSAGEEKPFDLVAVYKVDRFARKLKILLEVIDFFDKRKVEFISAVESIDTSTPFGRAILGIMGVIAELELETIKERSTGGRKVASKRGVYMGEHAPYGYKKDVEKRLTVFDEEAKIVKEIFHLFNNENKSAQQIATILRERKVLSPAISAIKHGKKKKGKIKKKNDNYFWRAEKIRKILKDEIYIGNYYYGKTSKGKKVPRDQWKISDYHHPPIIPKVVFAMTQEQLSKRVSNNKSRKRSKDDRQYILTGLLRCEQCYEGDLPRDPGKMFNWGGKRNKTNKKKTAKKVEYNYTYVCGKKNSKKYSEPCRVIPLDADKLENYVLSFVKKLIKHPKSAFDYYNELRSTKLTIKHLENERSSFRKMLNSIPNRRESILDLYEHGEINRTEYLKRKNQIELDQKRYKKRLDEIEYQLGQNEISAGYLTTFEYFSEKYKREIDSLEKKPDLAKDLLHGLIDHISIGSRKEQKSDKIRGAKSAKTRFVPDSMTIVLRLPHLIAKELGYIGFDVKKSHL